MNFIRSVSVYTLGNILNAGSAFLLLPIITSYLTPEENGIFSLMNLTLSILFSVMSLSSHGIVQAEFYRLDKTNLARLISSAFFNNISALLLVTICMPFAYYFMDLEISVSWLLILPLIAFTRTVHQVVLVLMQSLNKASTFLFLNSGLVILTLTLSFYFVSSLDLSWNGLLLAILISSTVVSCVGLILARKSNLLEFTFDYNLAVSALRFGLPLIPHSLGSLVIETSNRLLITSLLGIQHLGVYDIGFQIGKVIGLAETSFNTAYIPFLYESISKNDEASKIKVVRISYAFLGLLLLAVIFLNGIKGFLFDYINEDYKEATNYVFIIALGFFFSGIYKVFVGAIFFFKKVQILGYLAVFNVVTALGLNYFLISRYGLMGAAIASSLSFLINAVIIAYISNRLYSMPWLRFDLIFAYRK